MGPVRITSAIRQTLAALVLLPFLLVTLIAQGVMPQADSDGRFMVVLCGGDGSAATSVDLRTGERHTGERHGQEFARHPCALALAHTPTLLLAGLPQAAPSGRVMAAVALKEQALLPGAVAPDAFDARGPPTIL